MPRARLLRRPYLDGSTPHFASPMPVVASAKPIYVLIPGLGAEGKIWAYVAATLTNLGHEAVILEPPGFGYRRPRDTYTLANAAKLVCTEEYLALDRPIIYVGHSAGAMMALELAKADPRTIGLVFVNGLMDSASDIIHRPFRSSLRHPRIAWRLGTLVLGIILPLPPVAVDFANRHYRTFRWAFWPLVARPGRMPRVHFQLLFEANRCPGALRALRTNRHYDLPSHAPDIQWPFLAIVGRRDPLTTKPHRSRFLLALPVDGYELRVLEAGHVTPIETTHEVVAALLKFAQRLQTVPVHP